VTRRFAGTSRLVSPRSGPGLAALSEMSELFDWGRFTSQSPPEMPAAAGRSAYLHSRRPCSPLCSGTASATAARVPWTMDTGSGFLPACPSGRAERDAVALRYGLASTGSKIRAGRWLSLSEMSQMSEFSGLGSFTSQRRLERSEIEGSWAACGPPNRGSRSVLNLRGSGSSGRCQPPKGTGHGGDQPWPSERSNPNLDVRG